ncbi:MAG: NUDIX domain-containing protein [Oceanicaulis sp.]
MTKRGPWTILSARIAYDNPWMRVTEYDVTRPDGAPGLYGVMAPKFHAVGVCPVFENGDTLLVGQHRFALDAFSWELPEGGAAPGEDLAEAARRELAEETGCTAVRLHPLTQLDVSNSVTEERADGFIAWELSEGAPDREGSEADMTVKRLPLQTALAMAMCGEIRDAFTVVMLAAADYKARTGALEPALARAILTRP